MKVKEGRNISQARKEIPQANMPEMTLFILEHNITLGKWFKDLPVLDCPPIDFGTGCGELCPLSGCFEKKWDVLVTSLSNGTKN